MKLTNRDKEILNALTEKRFRDEYDHFPEEGSDYHGIAKIIFGNEVLDCEKPGGRYVSNLKICYSTKASLSRSLHKLFRNGVVKKCKPAYRQVWNKAGPESGGGYPSTEMRWLSAAWINEKGVYCTDMIRVKRYVKLPHKAKRWWMLTEKGKQLSQPRR